MALSIKDEETDALVRQLARKRNLSYTAAIKLAVSNELAKASPVREKDREEILAAIREIQDRVAERGGLPTRKDIDDWLYDENGLPH